MCGIAGVYSFNSEVLISESVSQNILKTLSHRGPDFQDYKKYFNCALFHSRLSIIDISNFSNQPFTHEESNNALVYNGEIYNFKQLGEKFLNKSSHSDVEIIYDLLTLNNENILNQFNGFFALGFYDSKKNELLVARDRFGVKPLYYYQDDNKFCFASELKPLLELTGKQELNFNALHTYLRLNYITGKETIFKNIFRLLPGETILASKNGITIKKWYHLPKTESHSDIKETLTDAVRLRLYADVPVGCFLSGGLDSSIISAIAKQIKPSLQTFSIGFRDEPFFDETHYAELVAKHIKSNHHVFKLSNHDFLNSIQPFLDSIDEPFADSSALNFYMLSKYAQPHVKVALSGDGADELFMGYNKHRADYLSNQFLYRNLLPTLNPILGLFKGSRNSKFANKTRQLKRFSSAARLKPKEKYISWACISSHQDVKALLNSQHKTDFDLLFEPAFSQHDFNPINLADLRIVLADDMLVKADRMSMQHGLEIRNPFLDYRMVELAMNLPIHHKINSHHQKIILRKNFDHLLPSLIFTRTKKGFEIPLWKWLKYDLLEEIESKWLNKEVIESQNIFNYNRVSELIEKLKSKYPGDAPSQLWALIVFQNWYKNFQPYIRSEKN